LKKTGSFSEYARHRGVAPSYVTSLRHQGRIVMREVNGKQVVDFDATDKLVAATGDPMHAAHTAGSHKPRKGVNARHVGAEQEGIPIREAANVAALFRKAQAQERAFNAKIAELTYREKVGQLVRADVVRAAWAKRIAGTRNALMQIPHRVAATLAAETDPDRVGRILEDELRNAMVEMSRGESNGT
jgi:hypothetical protein